MIFTCLVLVFAFFKFDGFLIWDKISWLLLSILKLWNKSGLELGSEGKSFLIIFKSNIDSFKLSTLLDPKLNSSNKQSSPKTNEKKRKNKINNR